MSYDFSGWATRNDIKCSDGRTIRKDAFKHCDGQTVPLVWNHSHNDPNNVLGHALLENRNEGVYTYCTFNDTEAGQNAKTLVQHRDVTSLSIYANKLKQKGGDVLHGSIREVSLVLAGANPGAYIDSVIMHGERSEEEAIIYTDEEIVQHSQNLEEIQPEPKEVNNKKEKEIMPEENKDQTVGDVIDSMNETQKNVFYATVGTIAQEKEALQQQIEELQAQLEHAEEEGDEYMKHNVFDTEEMDNTEYLSHSEMDAIFSEAKRYGSLKDAVLEHSITNIDYLFPDAQNVTNTPGFIQRDHTWVQKVMSGVHHTPFSRIKSTFADITGDDARALGYIKGKLKKEEVSSLLKRTTTPQTIYKKQKLDRDDVVDITDFDVVAWIKSEMRVQLDEEIARAILVGDGRLASSDDKIKEDNIRPIINDADLYTIKYTMTSYSGENLVDDAVRAKKDYKGSGSPVCFMTEATLTDCLLIKDTNKHRLYKDVKELATAMCVSEIITVPVMENVTRTANSKTYDVKAIIVNLTDYNVGADKGGAVNMFDDFDIDYNAQKYLIETRCSGALIKPYSAIVMQVEHAAS